MINFGSLVRLAGYGIAITDPVTGIDYLNMLCKHHKVLPTLPPTMASVTNTELITPVCLHITTLATDGKHYIVQLLIKQSGDMHIQAVPTSYPKQPT